MDEVCLGCCAGYEACETYGGDYGVDSLEGGGKLFGVVVVYGDGFEVVVRGELDGGGITSESCDDEAGVEEGCEEWETNVAGGLMEALARLGEKQRLTYTC